MKTSLVILILVSFLITSIIGPMPQAMADDFHLPTPGVMVRLSPPLDPPMLKGIKVDPNNPFHFDFILDRGDSSMTSPSVDLSLKEESSKLVKYFLAGLTIPEKDLWVNLSPYEKNRIIPSSFGRTEMGRDLLAEDYMLKQITASLIYPEDTIGKKFWKRVYEEAAKRYGTTNIPINTFNKVWIVPQKAIVYENAKAGTAYVMDSKLKVMLEQDYLSLEKHSIALPSATRNDISSIGANIVREIVIPELTREVNENKNFAKLRQVFNSLILATWYKKKIKDSILEQVYVNMNKTVGVQYASSVIPAKAGIQKNYDVELIYQRYLRAFKKGVYNYIKEDIDPLTQETIPRKYFSGGITATDLETDKEMQVTPKFNAGLVGTASPLQRLVLSVNLTAAFSNPSLSQESLNPRAIQLQADHRMAEKDMNGNYEFRNKEFAEITGSTNHGFVTKLSFRVFRVLRRAGVLSQKFAKFIMRGRQSSYEQFDAYLERILNSPFGGKIYQASKVYYPAVRFDFVPLFKQADVRNVVGVDNHSEGMSWDQLIDESLVYILMMEAKNVQLKEDRYKGRLRVRISFDLRGVARTLTIYSGDAFSFTPEDVEESSGGFDLYHDSSSLNVYSNDYGKALSFLKHDGFIISNNSSTDERFASTVYSSKILFGFIKNKEAGQIVLNPRAIQLQTDHQMSAAAQNSAMFINKSGINFKDEIHVQLEAVQKEFLKRINASNHWTRNSVIHYRDFVAGFGIRVEDYNPGWLYGAIHLNINAVRAIIRSITGKNIPLSSRFYLFLGGFLDLLFQTQSAVLYPSLEKKPSKQTKVLKPRGPSLVMPVLVGAFRKWVKNIMRPPVAQNKSPMVLISSKHRVYPTVLISALIFSVILGATKVFNPLISIPIYFLALFMIYKYWGHDEDAHELTHVLQLDVLLAIEKRFNKSLPIGQFNLEKGLTQIHDQPPTREKLEEVVTDIVAQAENILAEDMEMKGELSSSQRSNGQSSEDLAMFVHFVLNNHRTFPKYEQVTREKVKSADIVLIEEPAVSYIDGLAIDVNHLYNLIAQGRLTPEMFLQEAHHLGLKILVDGGAQTIFRAIYGSHKTILGSDSLVAVERLFKDTDYYNGEFSKDYFKGQMKIAIESYKKLKNIQSEDLAIRDGLLIQQIRMLRQRFPHKSILVIRGAAHTLPYLVLKKEDPSSLITRQFLEPEAGSFVFSLDNALSRRLEFKNMGLSRNRQSQVSDTDYVQAMGSVLMINALSEKQKALVNFTLLNRIARRITPELIDDLGQRLLAAKVTHFSAYLQLFYGWIIENNISTIDELLQAGLIDLSMFVTVHNTQIIFMGTSEVERILLDELKDMSYEPLFKGYILDDHPLTWRVHLKDISVPLSNQVKNNAIKLEQEGDFRASENEAIFMSSETARIISYEYHNCTAMIIHAIKDGLPVFSVVHFLPEESTSLKFNTSVLLKYREILKYLNRANGFEHVAIAFSWDERLAGLDPDNLAQLPPYIKTQSGKVDNHATWEQRISGHEGYPSTKARINELENEARVLGYSVIDLPPNFRIRKPLTWSDGLFGTLAFASENGFGLKYERAGYEYLHVQAWPSDKEMKSEITASNFVETERSFLEGLSLTLDTNRAKEYNSPYTVHYSRTWRIDLKNHQFKSDVPLSEQVKHDTYLLKDGDFEAKEGEALIMSDKKAHIISYKFHECTAMIIHAIKQELNGKKWPVFGVVHFLPQPTRSVNSSDVLVKYIKILEYLGNPANGFHHVSIAFSWDERLNGLDPDNLPYLPRPDYDATWEKRIKGHKGYPSTEKRVKQLENEARKFGFSVIVLPQEFRIRKKLGNDDREGMLAFASDIGFGLKYNRVGKQYLHVQAWPSDKEMKSEISPSNLATVRMGILKNEADSIPRRPSNPRYEPHANAWSIDLNRISLKEAERDVPRLDGNDYEAEQREGLLMSDEKARILSYDFHYCTAMIVHAFKDGLPVFGIIHFYPNENIPDGPKTNILLQYRNMLKFLKDPANGFQDVSLAFSWDERLDGVDPENLPHLPRNSKDITWDERIQGHMGYPSAEERVRELENEAKAQEYGFSVIPLPVIFRIRKIKKDSLGMVVFATARGFGLKYFDSNRDEYVQAWDSDKEMKSEGDVSRREFVVTGLNVLFGGAIVAALSSGFPNLAEAGTRFIQNVAQKENRIVVLSGQWHSDITTLSDKGIPGQTKIQEYQIGLVKNFKADTPTNQEYYERYVESILDEQREVIESQKEDIENIKQDVEGPNQSKTIAAEFSQDELDRAYREYRDVIVQLRDAMRAKNIPPEMINDVFVYLLGPVLYLYFQKVFDETLADDDVGFFNKHGLKIAALDDDKTKRRMIDIIHQTAVKFQELDSIVIDPTLEKKIIDNVNAILDLSDSPNEIAALFQLSKGDKKLRKWVKEFLKLAKAQKVCLDERSLYMAKKIDAIPGNVVVIVGQFHYDFLKRAIGADLRNKLIPRPNENFIQHQKQSQNASSARKAVLNKLVAHVGRPLLMMGVAMKVKPQRHSGGIDLTPANMNLQTRVVGNDKALLGGIKFHLTPAMLARLQNALGFVPVIVNIKPLNDLKQFLGVEE